MLSETGLYASRSSHELQHDVRAYTPAFELWSDGASKRRFIMVPAGAQIDTRDADAWQFPVGTKLWKEFSVQGKRVETRYLEKLGPEADDWLMLPFVWRAQQDDAVLAVDGARDALGTPHDVPAARDCMGCHGGTPSRELGEQRCGCQHDAEQHLPAKRLASRQPRISSRFARRHQLLRRRDLHAHRSSHDGLVEVLLRLRLLPAGNRACLAEDQAPDLHEDFIDVVAVSVFRRRHQRLGLQRALLRFNGFLVIG